MSEEIRKILENHEKRISVLEQILKEKTEMPKEVKVEYTGIAKRILELRDRDDFFKTPKTVKDVQLKLKANGFYYMPDRVAMALLRLVRKKELRRILEGKKFAYVYP
jgi:hypothetical protein